jgi:putative SOS response-associated peptidase YedK
MCNLYSITRGQEAMRRLFRVTRDLTGPSRPASRLPGHDGAGCSRCARSRTRADNDALGLSAAAKPPVTNVRNVKAPYWRLWLKTEWRCLVPATSFCEWSDSRPKVTHWFALDESRPLFALAGIWRLWTGERKGETGQHELFSFLTTEANEVVRPVHAKAMPVLLTAPGDWDTWLTGPVDEAMALQRPPPDAVLRVVAAGDKTDGTKPA